MLVTGVSYLEIAKIANRLNEEDDKVRMFLRMVGGRVDETETY